jgi:hypothetical protein
VRGALFQKEQNCFESGVLIFHKLLRIMLGKNDSISIFPFICMFEPKNATSELPSLLFFASKLFNLAD